jgi:hypothetical protein
VGGFEYLDGMYAAAVDYYLAPVPFQAAGYILDDIVGGGDEYDRGMVGHILRAMIDVAALHT